MIGIYQDSFKKYLEDNLGGEVKVTSKEIICKCPWCDVNRVTSKNHLNISKDAPIFHCFRASCEVSGRINKLIRKISGHDISDNFIDKEKIKENKSFNFDLKNEQIKKDIILPKVNSHLFLNKKLYLKKRLKFANIDIDNIKGLVFDVNSFISSNNITIDETLFRIKDFLHSNFVGFLTENKSTLILRNIDKNSTFRFFKIKIQNSILLDYYKLNGNLKDSNTVVLSEGIFDIYVEHIFDNMDIKNSVRLYASSLSSNFNSLIKSLVFHEHIFRLNVIILSDNGIPIEKYKMLKKYNKHIIHNLCVYYNKTGKDFNDNFVTPIKFIV